MVVTVTLNKEEAQLLQELIEYLQKKESYARVTKSDAIRHAITQSDYKKRKKS